MKLTEVKKWPALSLSVFSTGFFSFAVLYSFYKLFVNYRNGGNMWKQGDWLINSEMQPIRRAFMGDIILAISDALSTSPLLVTIMIQTIVFLTLVCLLFILLRQKEVRSAIWVILISPAFFVFFWASDQQGSMRKELFIYLALACLATSGIRQSLSRPLIVASLILFVLGALSHEAMALFFPAYVFCFVVMAHPAKISPLFMGIAILIALVASTGTIYFSIQHPSVSDIQDICLPLTSRGLDPSICEGAIDWLQKDVESSREIVREVATTDRIVKLIAGYALSAIAMTYFIGRTNMPYKLFALYVLAGLPFIPLFVLGIDWGRWLNFHFTSVAFIVLCLLVSGHLKIERPPAYIYLAPILLSSIFWSVGHIDPFLFSGILDRAFTIIF